MRFFPASIIICGTLTKPTASGHGVPLGMSSIRPECLDPVPSGRSVAADVLVREEPDDEEEEEDDGKEEDDEDEENEEGYSE